MALNLLFTIFSNTKGLMKFIDKPGVPITVVTGGALVGLSVYTAITEHEDPDEAYNAFYQAQAIIAPVPQLLKWLVPIKSNIALGILLGFDSVCDVANGGLGWAASTS